MPKPFHLSRVHQAAAFAVMLGFALPALAADYYVVAPLPGKQHLVDGISVALNATPLPTGLVGVPYAGFNLSSALQVRGDPAFSPTNVVWSVAAGALPAGLTMNKGVISGTPTAAGAQTFTVRATYKTKTGEQAYQVVVLAIAVALASGPLPLATPGMSFTYDFNNRLSVTGDPGYAAGNVAWSVARGALPAGLALSPSGVLSGVTEDVAEVGTPLTIAAQYRTQSASQAYTLYPGDPSFAQVAALLKFEGTVGSTTPVDAKGASFSAVNGAVLSPTVKKFGASSAYFPGAWSNAIVGPPLSLPGDFTLEAWVYPTDTSEIRVIMGQWSQQTPDTGGYLFWLAGGKLTYIFGPKSVSYAMMSAPTALPVNAWSHVAVTRVGSTFRMFTNGVQVATDTSALPGRTLSIPFAMGQYYNFTGELGVGGWGVPTGVQGYAGYMDDVRVSTVGRYVTDFTPPARGFPSQ